MKKIALACLAALVGISGQAMSYDKGDIVLRVGGAIVSPEGDGAATALGHVDVDDNTQLGINLTYMLTDNIGLGVLGATPFKHDITLDGATIGETKHLPPTITAQYHFNTGGPLHPYVGLGLNYTDFFEETTVAGPLELDSSVGLALEAGMDYSLNKHWGLGIAVWNVDIDSDATLHLSGGDANFTVEIDPWVYMIGASYKF